MKRWICSCLVLLLCAFQTQAGQSSKGTVPSPGARVLDVPASTAPLTKAQHSALERLKGNDRSIEWIIPIEFDPTALQHDVIEAFLFDRNVVIRRVEDDSSRFQNRSGSRAGERWQGEVLLPGESEDIDHMGLRDATFYINPNGNVTAYIRVGEIVYILRGAGPGNYSLTKQDLSKLHKGGGDVFDPGTGLPYSEFEDQPSFIFPPPFIPNPIPPRQIHRADVVVAFSTEAMRENFPALSLEVHAAVGEAETALDRSGVPLYLDVAAFAQPGYSEVSITRTLSDLRRGMDGPLWLAHVAREDSYADVIIMVVEGNA